uniref:Uncharacterized protein n=1 Tax=Plectus sambesii TaxID=2011161 RepID=A0A914W968_9BILA
MRISKTARLKNATLKSEIDVRRNNQLSASHANHPPAPAPRKVGSHRLYPSYLHFLPADFHLSYHEKHDSCPLFCRPRTRTVDKYTGSGAARSTGPVSDVVDYNRFAHQIGPS